MANFKKGRRGHGSRSVALSACRAHTADNDPNRLSLRGTGRSCPSAAILPSPHRLSPTLWTLRVSLKVATPCAAHRSPRATAPPDATFTSHTPPRPPTSPPPPTSDESAISKLVASTHLQQREHRWWGGREGERGRECTRSNSYRCLRQPAIPSPGARPSKLGKGLLRLRGLVTEQKFQLRKVSNP